jgi:hypothetical protein
MKITQDILDDLTAKAKESPRLRMNIDLQGEYHWMKSLLSAVDSMKISIE